MRSHQRRMAIYDLLLKHNTVLVSDLAQDFNVSTMTIRRDLMLFAKQGLVTTTYGGAYLNQKTTIEPSFALKATRMTTEKESMGSYCASLIEENDTIIIDCGSTALQVAKHLPNVKLTVITNSWPLISILGNNAKIKLILAPGQYSITSAGALDSMTATFFKNINADKVFMSSQAYQHHRGLTVPESTDAQVKKSMLNAANHRYLLLDHSKINTTCMAKHADLSDFDLVIVDQAITDEAYQYLLKENNNVVKA